MILFFAIFRNSPQFFCNYFLPVHLACLLVPYVSPVQKCCSLRLREVRLQHRQFPPQFSRNFPQDSSEYFLQLEAASIPRPAARSGAALTLPQHVGNALLGSALPSEVVLINNTHYSSDGGLQE